MQRTIKTYSTFWSCNFLPLTYSNTGPVDGKQQTAKNEINLGDNTNIVKKHTNDSVGRLFNDGHGISKEKWKQYMQSNQLKKLR